MINITTILMGYRSQYPPPSLSLPANLLPSPIPLHLQCHFISCFTFSLPVPKLKLSSSLDLTIAIGLLAFSFLQDFAHSIPDASDATCLLCSSQSHTFFHAQVTQSFLPLDPSLLCALRAHQPSLYPARMPSSLAISLSILVYPPPCQLNSKYHEHCVLFLFIFVAPQSLRNGFLNWVKGGRGKNKILRFFPGYRHLIQMTKPIQTKK